MNYYPRIYLPANYVEGCRKWAQDNIKPEHAHERSRQVAIRPDSPENFEVQFQGKLREAALCLYFGLLPSVTINLRPGVSDQFDVPVGPILIDAKGSTHPDAELMPYSVGRTNAGLYEQSRFTHFAMLRGDAERGFEICGWMTKQEFYERHLIAPHNNYPRTAKWIPGTWFVPIEWLNPIKQLRCYRGPYYDHAYRLIHYCQHKLCGEEAPFGYGVSLRNGKLGTYYCAEHRPQPQAQESAPAPRIWPPLGPEQEPHAAPDPGPPQGSLF